MDRKAISAYLVGCEPETFMAYADLGEKGTVVVGPDGKKYRFDNDQLAQAEAARSEAQAPKPKPKAKRKTPAKQKTASKAKTRTDEKIRR